MSDALQIRCQRCGTQMDMRDPGPGMPWTPDQFWVCAKCGRHFWSTYPPPKPKAAPAPEAKSAAEAKPAPAAAKPAVEASS
jgi:DNA-directed RNA polymerase subunit RPC12/RpoP